MIHTIDVNVKLIVQPRDLMSSKSLVTIHFVLKDNAQALHHPLPNFTPQSVLMSNKVPKPQRGSDNLPQTSWTLKRMKVFIFHLDLHILSV